jgi:hypothetical protein
VRGARRLAVLSSSEIGDKLRSIQMWPKSGVLGSTSASLATCADCVDSQFCQLGRRRRHISIQIWPESSVLDVMLLLQGPALATVGAIAHVRGCQSDGTDLLVPSAFLCMVSTQRSVLRSVVELENLSVQSGSCEALKCSVLLHFSLPSRCDSRT